jgi:hypothetical protein
MKNVLLIIVLIISLCNTIKSQNNFAFQLNGGPLFITESEFANTGVNFSASILYHLSNHIDLSLRSGYLNWSSKEESPVHSFSFSSYNIPLVGGIRYYFLLQNIRPYVSTEIGISFIKTKITNDIYFAHTYKKITPTEKVGSWSGYTFGISGGVYIILTKNLNLDINITAQHPEVSYEYVQLSAGLGFGIL